MLSLVYSAHSTLAGSEEGVMDVRQRARFQPDREPLKANLALHLDDDRVIGPLHFLNPTRARFHHTNASEKITIADPTRSQTSKTPGIAYKWSSRNNRKGRHAIAISHEWSPTWRAPAATNDAKEVAKGLWRMCTTFPVWDVSYLVAIIFTLGSVVWVLNAFFVFYPDLKPESVFGGEILYGGGITAFIGATIFEIGSVLLMLEAINENRAGCFGWALEQVYEEHSDRAAVPRLVASEKACTHHHVNRKNLVGKATAAEQKADENQGDARGWTWWPSTQDLRTHYLHDLGFLACSSQMTGATIFWISGFTALPGIYNNLSPRAVTGVYWTPQVIGGLGFVISGSLFMLETQKHWWQPAPKVLGWHIGLWNLIGGWGFMLSPCFGYSSAEWAQFQAGCSTFWGKFRLPDAVTSVY
nr:hypothetical protein B0A51_17387 [Rachicladosporium sp. CCFEE 5018]